MLDPATTSPVLRVMVDVCVVYSNTVGSGGIISNPGYRGCGAVVRHGGWHAVRMQVGGWGRSCVWCWEGRWGSLQSEATAPSHWLRPSRCRPREGSAAARPLWAPLCVASPDGCRGPVSLSPRHRTVINRVYIQPIGIVCLNLCAFAFAYRFCSHQNIGVNQ